MVLIAIEASGNGTATATAGPVNVNGRFYSDIVTDIVDKFQIFFTTHFVTKESQSLCDHVTNKMFGKK